MKKLFLADCDDVAFVDKKKHFFCANSILTFLKYHPCRRDSAIFLGFYLCSSTVATRRREMHYPCTLDKRDKTFREPKRVENWWKICQGFSIAGSFWFLMFSHLLPKRNERNIIKDVNWCRPDVSADKNLTYLSAFLSFRDRLWFRFCEFTKFRKKTKTIAKDARWCTRAPFPCPKFIIFIN
jgi:hypothetical protein